VSMKRPLILAATLAATIVGLVVFWDSEACGCMNFAFERMTRASDNAVVDCNFNYKPHAFIIGREATLKRMQTESTDNLNACRAACERHGFVKSSTPTYPDSAPPTEQTPHGEIPKLCRD